MKRKRTVNSICFTVAILMLLATAVNMTWAADIDMPGADADAFWKYITKTNPYTEWELWPGKDGIYKGTHPHGAYLKLFANETALKAARAGKEMPPGSIIVKENYGKDAKTLMAVTPMYKIEGYDPENDNWFWAKYEADGTVEKAGKVEGCIKCHGKVRDQNWIFNVIK
jgi:hypothetical protein